MTNAEILTPAPAPTAARVRRVFVKSLFGRFKHSVELRREERVTILLGPNGVGKTRLLELVAALAQGRIDQLTAVPFEELRVELDDDRVIVVRRNADAAPLDFSLSQHGQQKERWVARPKRTPFHFMSVPPSQASIVALPEWLRTLFERNPVHLIETQRLVRWRRHDGKGGDPQDDAQPVSFAVEELADDLANRVADAQSQYAREAQRLEKTYVERLLRPRETTEVSMARVHARLVHLAVQRTRLESLGLLAADEPVSTGPAVNLQPEQVRVVDLFTTDMERKLNVLEPLARSIELLVGSVNAKFRDKKLRLSRTQGLVVECEPDGRPIEVQALSSGEQHELVLLFDLIFRVQKGTLVLIDEPELSLHPEWQMQFVDDLMTIAQDRQFDVLLATHSPYIVGTRSDLCVALRSEPQ